MNILDDRWAISAYFSCAFAEGYKLVYLDWCDGKSISVFDCFAARYLLKRDAIVKLIGIEAWGLPLPHTINNGYLEVNYYNGTKIVCPWDVADAKFNKRPIVLPTDFNFQVILPIAVPTIE